MYKSIYLIAIFVLFAGCMTSEKKEHNSLLVYCAASLTDVIGELGARFENESGVEVKLSLASSGTLARQIEHGAEPDIFISANKNWFDYLEGKNLLVEGSGNPVIGNKMVLVAPAGSEIEPFDLTKKSDFCTLFSGSLSIGDPAHVPAGTYAMQILEKLGCKEALPGRLLTSKDVRTALMIVELGEADAGIVYKTDAMKSRKVKILTEFPDSLHDDIAYYMALVKPNANPKSKEFYDFLRSEAAMKVWKTYGFENKIN